MANAEQKNAEVMAERVWLFSCGTLHIIDHLAKCLRFFFTYVLEIRMGQAHLLETIGFLEDKEKLLEKKLELERIQHSEALQKELIKVQYQFGSHYVHIGVYRL